MRAQPFLSGSETQGGLLNVTSKKIVGVLLGYCVLMTNGMAADGQVVLSDFGPGAITESFEGQSIGNNIPEVRAGILLPGAIGPYTFPSGVALTAPVPNPIPGFELFDYTLTTISFSLCEHPGDPKGGVVRTETDVPDGSAYVALDTVVSNTGPVEFTFLEDMLRVGALVNAEHNSTCDFGQPSNPIVISAYDASGALVASASVGAVGIPDWANNFLGVESSAGIRSVRFEGDYLMLDGLIFEAPTAPESPLIDPIVGHFSNAAANLGEPAVSENTSLLPLTNFSQTAASGLATSSVDVVLSDTGDSAQIEITNLVDIDIGGSESGFSFALQFDLLEDAAYEISGTFTASYTGLPESGVQFVSGPQFNALSPFTVLFFESDNESGGASSVNFTMNGVNEGNIGGNRPGSGLLTGDLTAGRYQLTGLTSVFSRGGGFAATGRSDLLLKLTTTVPTCARTIFGTPSNDLLGFEGELQPLLTTIVNSYSGESISIDDTFKLNVMCYDGLEGIDYLRMSNASDVLFIENADGAQTIFNIETLLSGRGDDVIDLASSQVVIGDTIILAGSGNDIVWANAGNDTIEGSTGNDKLNGGPGNDKLQGGADNDTLRGWTGNDTYFYTISLDGGTDIIREGGGGLDTLEFGADVLPGDVSTSAQGDDLTVTTTGIIITIENQFGASGLDTVERMLFADGTSVDITSRDQPPTAEAGANQSIHVRDLVTLDGSGSFDDVTPSENLLYNWSFDSVPDGSAAAFSGNGTTSPTFIADLPGDYVVSLVVLDDGNRASQPDYVTISSLNVPPTADAGMDRGAIVGEMVALDGSASSDADMDAISFAWSMAGQPPASSASLIGAGTVSPFFVANNVPGTYIVQLVVNDGLADSVPDQVTITVITAEAFAELNAMEALNNVGALARSSVTTKGNQTALSQHLTQVIKALQNGDIDTSRMKLTQAIERTDGCALRTVPDAGTGPGPQPKQDYITSCADQSDVYVLLTDALAAVGQ